MGGEALHIPVLAQEAVDWLELKPDGTYVDCTAGAGGHSALIAAGLVTGRLLALDRDLNAVKLARERLAPWPTATVVHANYAKLREVLAEAGVMEVDGILLDAGVSSMQIDAPERGFSFQQPGPLDMRMDTGSPGSAREYLATVSEERLAEILRTYGDLRTARRIARAIVQRRQAGTLESTADLAAAVGEAFPALKYAPDEVRTVFQAVRIAVNDELAHLESGVRQALDALAPGGRLVVISFHSGEDRVVKQLFAEYGRRRREFYPDGRVKATVEPVHRVLTAKPVVPGESEMRANPRSKSAKMRVAERMRSGTDETGPMEE